MAITYRLDTSVYSQPLEPAPHPGVVVRWQALGSVHAPIHRGFRCRRPLLTAADARLVRTPAFTTWPPVTCAQPAA